MRDLARQLGALETPGTASMGVDHPAAFRAVDRLRPHLSELMGRSGFRALLARALVRATAEIGWLSGVVVVADGELQGLPIASAGADDFSAGEAALLAHLLGLLDVFIGPALTVRLVTQIWPQLSFGDADVGGAESNEEAT